MADHQWPEAMRKRARDEEEEGATNGLLGFTEHRNVSAVHHDMLWYSPRELVRRPPARYSLVRQKHGKPVTNLGLIRNACSLFRYEHRRHTNAGRNLWTFHLTTLLRPLIRIPTRMMCTRINRRQCLSVRFPSTRLCATGWDRPECRWPNAYAYSLYICRSGSRQ
jgi:hypothetical protein